jgi:hypothetical protein
MNSHSDRQRKHRALVRIACVGYAKLCQPRLTVGVVRSQAALAGNLARGSTIHMSSGGCVVLISMIQLISRSLLHSRG